MSFKHNTAKVSTGIDVHYVEAGDPSDPCVILIHGYPQTWYMYRHVIADMAKAGYHIIAPDYRGAGQTSLSPTQDSKEDTGYDKFSMAADLHALYKEVLGVDKAFIVGIDIGSMVATALALKYREDVIGLFASECPQPGTKAYEISTTSDVWKYERVYHFFFHTGKYLILALCYPSLPLLFWSHLAIL
ncbi:hypothetical protein FFLO_07170 [Filobasidium floriforme]|uniref:AB hydrolase-1 domain-containing protein n=1 Tax=Filobasidium floriforme TaxID=5210 RepID=A0A8K0JDI1_9TREE|nr:hypothetical protein FFLO_07170 [Filobasidium floriforme]